METLKRQMTRLLDVASGGERGWTQFWRPIEDGGRVILVAQAGLDSTRINECAQILGLSPSFRQDSVSLRTTGTVHLRSVLRGTVFAGSVENLVKGALEPAAASRIVSRIGLKFATAVPVRQQRGRVYGTLVRLTESPPDPFQMQRFLSLGRLAEHVVNADPRPLRRRGTAATLAAEERFRREVAEELHGPIQTKLFLAINALKTLSEEIPAAQGLLVHRLNAVVGNLEHLQEEDIRRLSHRLHPGIIRVALRPALRLLQSRFADLTTVAFVSTQVFDELDTPIGNAISERTRLAVYRVVEEAILNAVRHGKAQQVLVSVDVVSGRTLEVVIRDDGHGFSVGAPGLGLQMMSSRVASVHGTLDIMSSPGEGTEVRMSIPMTAAARTLRRRERDRVAR